MTLHGGKNFRIDMDNQNPKQDESTSQFETPLRELQAIRKEQTDFM